MAWTNPITVAAFQKFLDSYWNTYVTGNTNLLKTRIDDSGFLKIQTFGVGFVTGQGDVSTTSTNLTSYDYSIPANYLADGEALIVEGMFSLSATAATKSARIKVGGGTANQIFSTTQVSMQAHFRMRITRRSSTTGAIQGVVQVGASGAAVTEHFSINAALGTVDWTSAQTLRVEVTGSDAGDGEILLTEYQVWPLRGNGLAI